jgi:multiple sugar transport system substrate-binding protein
VAGTSGVGVCQARDGGFEMRARRGRSGFVWGAVAATASLCLALAACDSSPAPRGAAGGMTCDGRINGPSPTYVTAWYHTGTSAEKRVLGEQVAAFNRSQSHVRVKLTDIPEASYTREVQAAATSGNLPDILDLDGPFLYNYAFSGVLKPLNSCVSPRLRADLLPSILEQGMYAGRLWGIGTIDSGLGLYVRPSVLHRIGVRIPTGVSSAWTADEFTRILHRLRQAGYRQPLDLQMNAAGESGNREWFTYGFAPVIWSAGGDLINRASYRTAQGVLNGVASVRALTTMQQWFRAGLVNPNVGNTAFVRGRAPISWVGHWMYDAYHQAFPHDLRIVPLPRFGPHPASGLGSYQWGITSSATDGDAAWSFLDYLLRDRQVLQLTRADGAIPATRSAIRRSPAFAAGGPEHIYVQELEDGTARPRPQTPAYPAVTAAFSTAFLRIARGENVRRALDTAVRQIDANLADNHYYRPSGP